MTDQNYSSLIHIKATLYQHQCAAFEFTCRLFGLRGDEDDNGKVQYMRAINQAESKSNSEAR